VILNQNIAINIYIFRR